MPAEVIKHAWTNDGTSQVARAKAGTSEFSHPDDLPLIISTKKAGWLCRKVYVRTVEEIWYRDAVCQIAIDPGFMSDLASIPRSLWCLVSPYDLAYEGLLHDQVYRQQTVDRQYADFLLLHVMKKRGVPWYVRYPVWMAVRVGGKSAWELNKRRRERAKQA